MTKLNLNDLPPEARKRVEAKLAEQDGPTPASPTRSRTKRAAPTAGVDGWCATCGERLTSEPAWNRHSDATGHSRLELYAEPRLASPPPD